MELSEKDIARFWKYVDIRGEDECWEWKAGLDGSRYGILQVSGRATKAHRISYRIKNGEIDDSLIVMHSCDNPPCANPSHLSQGTHKDNAQDMLSKGRGNKAHGERNGNAKLTEGEVDEIRQAYAAGETQISIAARFGVVQQMVSNIVRMESWNVQK